MTHTTDQITILESNVNIFMERFIDAIKDGYEVQNTNYGWVSDGVLKEITLSEVPDKGEAAEQDSEQETPLLPYGLVEASSYDSQDFLNQVQSLLLGGATLDVNTLMWDMVGVKAINGSHHAHNKYTREQLNSLGWDELKDECKLVGVTGRDRGVLTSKYLLSTGQGL